MEPGGELTVRVADLSEGGGCTLLVEVSDTGRGIPDDLLEHDLQSLRDDQGARHRPGPGHLPRHRRRASRAHPTRGTTSGGPAARSPSSSPSPSGRTRPRRLREDRPPGLGERDAPPQLLRALEDSSVFTATSDEEALRTLRLTEVELIIKEATPPAQEPRPRSSTRARQLCARPGSSCACSRPRSTSPRTRARPRRPTSCCSTRSRPGTCRRLLQQAEEKLRLLQEVAALRSARRPVAESRSRGRRSRARPRPRTRSPRSRRSSPRRSPPASTCRACSTSSSTRSPSWRARAAARSSSRIRPPALPRRRVSRPRAPRGRVGQPSAPTAACRSGWSPRAGSSRSRRRRAGPPIPRPARSPGRWPCCRRWSPSRSPRTESWSASSPSASASPAAATGGARPRPCSTWRATWPPPSATSASITCSSTRRNSTSGSSRACRAASSPSVPSSAW